MPRRMNRFIDCPECKSINTMPTPETEWDRFCVDCLAHWDIRTRKEIEAEAI